MKLALRSLLRQPGFATVVVLSLAIGIALDTTMYGVLDALMRPRIDMRNPEQLYSVQLYGIRPGQVDNRVSDAALLSGLHTYESATRIDGQRTDLIELGQSMMEVTVSMVGSNFFEVTKPRVLAGRTFAAFDESAEMKPLVITDRLAERLFREGESPVGARVSLEGKGGVIVGVVSQATNFPRQSVSVWEISDLHPLTYSRVIRLREGATQADAKRELEIISARLAAEARRKPDDVAFVFHQASDPGYQVEDFQLALLLAVTAVLLVACANLANLQLARGIGRRREIALRSALGASQRRIIVHLLTESGLLVALGLALGLVGAYWGSRLLIASIPRNVGDYIVEPQFSWRVLAFSLVATTLCLVIVGLLPALTISRTDPNELLKSGAGTGAHKRSRRLYGVLVSAAIGLALVLTSGSIVLLRSWVAVTDVSYSFDTKPLTSGLVAVSLSPGKHEYSDVLHMVANRLRGVPNAADIAASMSTSYPGRTVAIDDGVSVRQEPTNLSAVTVVTPNYLRTLGLRILDGRDFLDGDRAAVIVDQGTARFLWKGKSPVGSLIKLGGARTARAYVRVIGVAANQRTFRRPDSADSIFDNSTRLGTVYYVPAPSDTFQPRPNAARVGVSIIARSTSRPERMALNLRREVAGWPDARFGWAGSWDDFRGSKTARDSARFVASLFTLFAVIGVGLAAFGVYGVVAHSVAERRRELGVRLALGASARNILHSVLRESVVVALAGTALGLLMTKYGVVLLKRLIVEDEMFNAPLFAGVAISLAAIVATAAFIPALRATRLDPTESLRNE